MGAGDGDARTGAHSGAVQDDAATEEYGEAALASYLETHSRELLSGRRQLSLSSRMLGRARGSRRSLIRDVRRVSDRRECVYICVMSVILCQ